MSIEIKKFVSSAEALKNTPPNKSDIAKTSSDHKSTPSTEDSVSLTPQAKSIDKIQKDISATPSFNKSKVEEIKKAISEGAYKVDPEKLAQNMLSFEQEFGVLER